MARPRMLGPGNAAGKKQFRRATRRPRVQKKALTQMIKKVVGGQEEKKFTMSTTQNVSFNSGISTTAEWYSCVPAVGVGVNPYNRIGAVIKPTLLDMNWRIGFNSGITRSCDDYVVLYVFKCKNLRSYADMVNRGLPATFLETGFGSNTAFTGQTPQIDFPVDNSLFTLVAKRVVHLQRGVGYLQGDNSTGYSGNGNKSAAHISIKIRKLPQFRYDVTGGDNLPDNYGLCWALGYAHADGSSPDVLNTDISVSTAHKLFFTDA